MANEVDNQFVLFGSVCVSDSFLIQLTNKPTIKINIKIKLIQIKRIFNPYEFINREMMNDVLWPLLCTC